MALPQQLEHAIRGGRLINPTNNADGSMSFMRPGGGKKVTYTAYELGRTPQGGQRQVGYLPNNQAPGQLGQILRGEGMPGSGRHPMALQAVQNAINVGGRQPGMGGVPWATEVDARRFGGLQTSTPQEGIASSLAHALGMGTPVGWQQQMSPSQVYQQALSGPMPGFGNERDLHTPLGHAGNPYMGHGNPLGPLDTLKQGWQTFRDAGNPFTASTRSLTTPNYYDTLVEQEPLEPADAGGFSFGGLKDAAASGWEWLTDKLGG